MLNSSVKRSLEITEGAIKLLRYIRTQIDCYSKPIEKILSECPREIYLECGYIKNDTPRTLSEIVTAMSRSDSGVYKVMSEFCAEFGKSYRAEQVKLCDRYIEELSEMRASASQVLPMRKKLNSTLCISGAAAIVILLI